jgi:hypothetical protein
MNYLFADYGFNKNIYKGPAMKFLTKMIFIVSLVPHSAIAGGIFCTIDGSTHNKINALYRGTPGSLTMTYQEGEQIINDYGSTTTHPRNVRSPAGITLAGRDGDDIGILTVNFTALDERSEMAGFFTRRAANDQPQVNIVSCRYTE